MSLFRWFTAKTAYAPGTLPPDSSGLAHQDATVPLRNAVETRHREVQGRAANRKTERLERRELLYGIVRDCMNRAGVLSASYKFKVLSLDSRGRQYLIMLDLPKEHAGNTTRLAEIEGLIAHAAKSSHDILVTAVYWRVNEHVTAGLSRTPPPIAPARPAPPALFEALQDDELRAFKRALATGAAAESVLPALPVTARAHDPGSTPAFQDTEVDAMALPLSATQYGELK